MFSLYIFSSQGDRSDGGDADPADNQSHSGDQSAQTEEEPPRQSDPSPPAIPDSNNEEKETEQESVKSQLSSSVIIDVPNVQASLELSTITGATVCVNSDAEGLTFSHCSWEV